MVIEKNFNGEIFDDIESMQEFHALMDMMGERECLILFASPELVSQIVNNDYKLVQKIETMKEYLSVRKNYIDAF